MNCAICHKPIVLIPSAQERARKDVCGNTAAYYTSLFTAHADCQLTRRNAVLRPTPIEDLPVIFQNLERLRRIQQRITL